MNSYSYGIINTYWLPGGYICRISIKHEPEGV